MQTILFLGGAPKSGTSYLFDLLAQHPNICPSQPKETFYFVDKNYPLARVNNNFFQLGVPPFQRYFTPDVSTHYLLEGSTHLLYQKETIRALATLDAKVIFVLREPAQRLLSAFEYTKNRGAILREAVSFQTYVTALLNAENTKIDAWVRKNVSYHFLKEELHFSTYVTYLKPWIEALGKERIKVLQFERLKQNPTEFTQAIFDDLDLTFYKPNTQIDRHNTYQIQNKRLHYYIRQLNKYMPKNQIRNQMRDWYFKLQKRPVQRDISDASLDSLKTYFRPYNEELANLTAIDLSLWE